MPWVSQRESAAPPKIIPEITALKCVRGVSFAPPGLDLASLLYPRLTPWAVICRPFGAENCSG